MESEVESTKEAEVEFTFREKEIEEEYGMDEGEIGIEIIDMTEIAEQTKVAISEIPET
jgi:hypothetical protein